MSNIEGGGLSEPTGGNIEPVQSQRLEVTDGPQPVSQDWRPPVIGRREAKLHREVAGSQPEPVTTAIADTVESRSALVQALVLPRAAEVVPGDPHVVVVNFDRAGTVDKSGATSVLDREARSRDVYTIRRDIDPDAVLQGRRPHDVVDTVVRAMDVETSDRDTAILGKVMAGIHPDPERRTGSGTVEQLHAGLAYLRGTDVHNRSGESVLDDDQRERLDNLVTTPDRDHFSTEITNQLSFVQTLAQQPDAISYTKNTPQGSQPQLEIFEVGGTNTRYGNARARLLLAGIGTGISDGHVPHTVVVSGTEHADPDLVQKLSKDCRDGGVTQIRVWGNGDDKHDALMREGVLLVGPGPLHDNELAQRVSKMREFPETVTNSVQKSGQSPWRRTAGHIFSNRPVDHVPEGDPSRTSVSKSQEMVPSVRRETLLGREYRDVEGNKTKPIREGEVLIVSQAGDVQRVPLRNQRLSGQRGEQPTRRPIEEPPADPVLELEAGEDARELTEAEQIEELERMLTEDPLSLSRPQPEEPEGLIDKAKAAPGRIASAAIENRIHRYELYKGNLTDEQAAEYDDKAQRLKAADLRNQMRNWGSGNEHVVVGTLFATGVTVLYNTAAPVVHTVEQAINTPGVAGKVTMFLAGLGGALAVEGGVRGRPTRRRRAIQRGLGKFMRKNPDSEVTQAIRDREAEY